MNAVQQERGALPEQTTPAVLSRVRLHALKAAHPVVQDLRGWVQGDGPEGQYSGRAPALSIHMLSQEHVICKLLAKAQLLHNVGT
jgi:hypothetical protein